MPFTHERIKGDHSGRSVCGRACSDFFRLAGEDGATAGMIMPWIVLRGSRYMHEVAQDVAMDRAHIISMNNKVETPAGAFENVLKIRETTILEPSDREFKYYAEGVGRIQDAHLKLEDYIPTEEE